MLKRKWTWIIILLSSSLLFMYCSSQNNISSAPEEKWLNLNDTVSYIGKEACKGCHTEIYNSFMRTGMGKSFDYATSEKSAASYHNHISLYDSIKNMHYTPHWKGDQLFITEFRLEGVDTIYKRDQQIDYVIGSGQHTNSHIYESGDGFVHQAPITFFTQKGIWDLAPGFEGGANAQFNRIISGECMSCHNGIAEFDEDSENRFEFIPQGIGCERCHGPGELHVQEKTAGKIVDTSKYIDYTIINPAHLDREAQLQLCQRCHLQGISVLNEGSSWYDFKPSMHLKEVMQVFLPTYEEQNHFIMASHAERMRKSECFKQSEMTCVTCHNPHVSVEETSYKVFNSKCISCHKTEDVCTVASDKFIAQAGNCSSCHMPVSSTIDIPHVTIHDHFIRKDYDSEEEKVKGKAVATFIGLECMTDESPSAITMAKGYLSFYEKYTANEAFLDSAAQFLSHNSVSKAESINERIHLAYLRYDYSKLQDLGKTISDNSKLNAWSAYRIGEAYTAASDLQSAKQYFEIAIQRKSKNLDFLNKLASVQVGLKDYTAAKTLYAKILALNPNHHAAINNLGYLKLLEGDVGLAEEYFTRSLNIDPDYLQALLNMANLKIVSKEYQEAEDYLKRILALQADHPIANKALAQLKLMQR